MKADKLSNVANEYVPVTDEQNLFNIFRVGKWPEYFPDVQFPSDRASLNQYLRQMTPNIGPIDINVNEATVIHLPSVGIYGNTLFTFSDLNNREIAERMSTWLDSKSLNIR
ncbi:hypothetical protein [Alteromonas confluentis]|uniref:Uncharacterized protein n=1 Tax=Alteromonas confluentis TaxID=1656094 RepID=A0A1E7ZFA0_9ALTE|nr:hypothetical protein [Alteromonas confluentis]OFC72205.1 hypothetical protein BFC18_04420 [Alteromonas confluentis]